MFYLTNLDAIKITAKYEKGRNYLTCLPVYRQLDSIFNLAKEEIGTDISESPPLLYKLLLFFILLHLFQRILMS